MVSCTILTGCLLTGCLSDDRDGDGLPNSLEEDGWPILVILLGETNKTEIMVSSDPDEYDTDDDGLSDYEEECVMGTKPVTADTDGDGLMDGAEKYSYSWSTDSFYRIPDVPNPGVTIPLDLPAIP